MAKCFPQQFIHGMAGGAVQNWVFTVPKRGLREEQCSVRVMNTTMDKQGIDADDGCTCIDIGIPARKRNVWVQLTDVNYKVTRLNLVRQGTGKVYFTAVNGGSQIYRG